MRRPPFCGTMTSWTQRFETCSPFHPLKSTASTRQAALAVGFDCPNAGVAQGIIPAMIPREINRGRAARSRCERHNFMIALPFRQLLRAVEGSTRKPAPTCFSRQIETNANKTKDFDSRQEDSVIYQFAHFKARLTH